ncbi:helix-turn-helix domain-containing protein [Streptomyces sp. NPDC090026]|uniref:helix-turn-helix domain-containing protein n=1 Tax=Streptomyces sp. NPDC090026 TaxID=3365923 RepID=UPI0037F82083
MSPQSPDDDLVTLTLPRAAVPLLWRLLGAWLLREYRNTGGNPSPTADRALRALRDAAHTPPSSAAGTPTAEPPTVDPGKVMGMGDVAAVLGCTPEYARRLARVGRLPAQRVGTVWTINPRDLDAYRYGRQEAPSGEPAPATPQPTAERR